MGRVVRNLQGVSIAHAVDAWYNPNCKFWKKWLYLRQFKNLLNYKYRSYGDVFDTVGAVEWGIYGKYKGLVVKWINEEEYE